MQRADVPFNVSILNLTPQKLQGVQQVTALDHFEGATGQYHPEGLFSPTIFGRVGDPQRWTRYGFIDIKIPIFHPVLFRALVSLKRLYAGIIAGNEFAVWNEEIKNFERSDPINGETGYYFFLKHWKDIDHGKTASVTREQNIMMLTKYADVALTSKIIVMPAGMRDIEVGDDGRIREDEINEIYRKLLRIANTISEAATRLNQDIINTPRYRLQLAFNELYDMLERMVEGKKKLILGKWGSRRPFNGTRNVISAMNTATPVIGAKGSPKFNDTIVGLYQACKAVLPVTGFLLRNGWLSRVFSTVEQPANLVNKRTLKMEAVALKPHYFDQYMTDEGIERVISAFADEGIRHKPLEIAGYYLGLIYKGPDGTYRIIQDIEELPEDRKVEDVHPMTFAEFLYLAVYKRINQYPIFVTRYPVAGNNSIYPSWMYVKPTVRTEVRRELGPDWEPLGDENTAYEFPTSTAFINTLQPHPARLEGMQADFDGDTSSGNAVYMDESVKEVRDYFTKRNAYVDVRGEFSASIATSTVSLVWHNLTREAL